MRKLILAATCAFMFTAPALAGQCPNLMGKIDEAMKTATVDDATKAQIMELYNTGKADHEAGNHDASVESLNKALALLGM